MFVSFYGFYWCINAGKSLTTINPKAFYAKCASDLHICKMKEAIKFVSYNSNSALFALKSQVE